ARDSLPRPYNVYGHVFEDRPAAIAPFKVDPQLSISHKRLSGQTLGAILASFVRTIFRQLGDTVSTRDRASLPGIGSLRNG
ncbi:MAG TPA: hypothetical protein VNO32_12695, partial [Candidatus Acidoferrum sp.]|nr:hypothetical protein [Candidatus Acidoferrum sp.]